MPYNAVEGPASRMPRAYPWASQNALQLYRAAISVGTTRSPQRARRWLRSAPPASLGLPRTAIQPVIMEGKDGDPQSRPLGSEHVFQPDAEDIEHQAFLAARLSGATLCTSTKDFDPRSNDTQPVT